MLTEARHLQPHQLEIAAGRRRRHPPLSREGGEGNSGVLSLELHHGTKLHGAKLNKKYNCLHAVRSRVNHHSRLGHTSQSAPSVCPIKPRLEISRAYSRTTFRLPHASPICATGALSLRPSSHHCLDVNELLIKGIRRDGSTFRPSDWAERLCGVAAILHSDAIAPLASIMPPVPVLTVPSLFAPPSFAVSFA